jgi:hypothetical protein
MCFFPDAVVQADDFGVADPVPVKTRFRIWSLRLLRKRRGDGKALVQAKRSSGYGSRKDNVSTR